MLWLGALLAVVAGGCATVKVGHEASEVGASTISAGAARGYAAADLKLGRELFLDRCTECHEERRPGDFTEEEWKDILPPMSRRAKLSSEQARCVEAYILSVMDTQVEGATKKKGG